MATKTYERWVAGQNRKVHILVNGESLCEGEGAWFTGPDREREVVSRHDFETNGCDECRWYVPPAVPAPVD